MLPGGQPFFDVADGPSIYSFSPGGKPAPRWERVAVKAAGMLQREQPGVVGKHALGDGLELPRGADALDRILPRRGRQRSASSFIGSLSHRQAFGAADVAAFSVPSAKTAPTVFYEPFWATGGDALIFQQPAACLVVILYI
jgi:hypothetical protein